MAEKKRKTSWFTIPTLSRGATPIKPLDPWAGVRASPAGLTHSPQASSNMPRQSEPSSDSRPVSEPASTSAQPPPKKAKVNNTISPSDRMKQFLKWAGVAQKTILEREAGPVYPLMCTGPCQSIIGDNSPAYRCFDCYRPPVQCKTCAVASHQQNPFHRIEEWQPALGFWQRRPLYDLGLVIQIGHPGGGTCYSSALPRRMTVVHEHGIHPAAIKYCECGGTANTPCLPEPLQLIRFGLFPGSWHQPETVYTINGLRDYHLLSLQSPITTMDYAAYLRRTTDNVQPDDAKDRYRELNTAMREFMFLRSTRRAGQDLESKPPGDLSVAEAPLGELPLGSLAVLCPACPQPEMNMAPDWTNRPDKDAYLDTLFYSIDGNFHHNQKMKPMDPKDSPLTKGAGYFVHEGDFAEYQARMKPPKKEDSSCNKFAALGHGRYTGRVSGMVGMTCSRHMFIFANSLVDLLKGEGFAWGDFSQVSGLQRWLHVLKLMCRGYDVNCQYDKKFLSRLELFSKNFSHLRSVQKTIFPPTRSLIPKFHAPAHTLVCGVYRSYNYTPGVGMTDGEAAERIWSAFNALAIRTKEMTAGHRHDVINDFHGDMNARRVHALPQALSTKHKNAQRQLAAATTHLSAMESNIVDKTVLVEWRRTEAAWERGVLDPTKHKTLRNPYLLDKDKGLTEKQLLDMMNKMRQAKEEHSLGPLGVVHQGTMLERQREQLLDELERDDITEDMHAALALRCAEFTARFGTWAALRDAYIGPLIVEAERLVREKTTATASLSSGVTALPQSSFVPQTATATNLSLNPAVHSRYFPLRDTSHDYGSIEKGLPPPRDAKGKSDLWQEIFSVSVLLPSSYDSALLQQTCMQELVKLEADIRRAQARDALDDLRAAIIGREAYKIKKKHATSKQHATRTTLNIRSMEDDVKEAANRYRRLRIALLALGMEDSDVTFRRLRRGDTVKYSLDAQHRALNESSEGKPWLWEHYTYSDAHGDGKYQAFYDDARRVHWFRASATQKRWHEEVQLLEEEMRRTMRFFCHHQHQWLDRAKFRDFSEEKGAAAYARRQAHRYARLLGRCRQEYAGRIDLNDLSLRFVDERPC